MSFSMAPILPRFGASRKPGAVQITKSQFETFWPETEGRRIEKTRWTGELPDGLQFELDVFEGDLAPLVTVEVEFSSLELAEAFRPPSWFGRELTSDKRYKNKVLAVSGLPQE
ncbi:hypothetical protein K3723_14020 [Leisingera caerulea]|uniref:hypothetical protein n=1 Tax=Leisingera caerulea TaxID=506591 RepID=UPI0021A57EBF|nr:hypothetical protein [Leisingera caerulea]UWQ61963.1 hypothetical protein K3723_14020 [Leisingera caerulea]